MADTDMYTEATQKQRAKNAKEWQRGIIRPTRHGDVDMEKRKKADKDIIPIGLIEEGIFTLRGKRVMLDADLAKLYGVTTKRLNEQVRRNADRFPEDFAFKLTDQEVTNLRSQFATSSDRPRGHGGRRYQPWVFTEHGAIMAASVLNSPRAVEVSVFVVRAFVKLRELSMAHKEIRQKLSELEQKVAGHDQAIADLINAIRELMTPPESKKKRPIGFGPWEE
jgi:ORF6N domain